MVEECVQKRLLDGVVEVGWLFSSGSHGELRDERKVSGGR